MPKFDFNLAYHYAARIILQLEYDNAVKSGLTKTKKGREEDLWWSYHIYQISSPDCKKVEKTKIIFVEDQKRGSLVKILENFAWNNGGPNPTTK